jgi:hypothetical protein
MNKSNHQHLVLMVGLLWALGLCAQTPEEHARHHPGAAGAGPGGMGPPAGVGPPGGMGGMGDMGEMMKGMGVPPPKDLYPSLMAVPELSPELRKQVEAQSGERMHAGTVLMSQALDTLNAGTQSGDYAAMHEATTRMREGIAQLFTMVLLIAFALAMVAMYFFKMRRAAALFGRLEADKGPAPPGEAPPLAGAPGPSAPGAAPAGKAPPEGTPPPAEPPPPAGESPPGPGAPLTANWRGQLRVGSIVVETPSVKTFRLLPASEGGVLPFTFVPGQFLERRVLDRRRANEPLVLHLVRADAARVRRGDRAARAAGRGLPSHR